MPADIKNYYVKRLSEPYYIFSPKTLKRNVDTFLKNLMVKLFIQSKQIQMMNLLKIFIILE